MVRQYASCARNALLERVDIIPNSMVATMAAAESGWGTSGLARENNNLFGMKCGAGRCRGAMKGLPQFESVEQSVQAYVTNLNTHPAYSSFRKSRLQLRKADQEVTASTMIHKLKGIRPKGRATTTISSRCIRTISGSSPPILIGCPALSPGIFPYSITSLCRSRYSFGVTSYSFLNTE